MSADQSAEKHSENHPEHKNFNWPSLERRQLISEVLILIIFVGMDAYSVWPNSHSIALAAGVGGISAVLFGALSVRRWATCTLALAILAALFRWYSGPALKSDVELAGVLIPASDETSEPCGPPAITLPDSRIVALMGGNEIVADFSTNITKLRVLTCDAVTLEKMDDGVGLSARIYDASGNPVGDIKRNAWHAIEGENSHISLAGGMSTLSVTDDAGRTLFWAKYLNKNTVKIQGTFVCKNKTINITDDAASSDGMTVSKSCFYHNATLSFLPGF